MSNTAKLVSQDDKRTAETTTVNGIKVAIRIPYNVAENIKQQKINRIYDILCPGASR